MANTEPSIITKVLLPRQRSNFMPRRRLVDFIHEHIDRKLLLISAGAGYGKTSLLADYAHDTDLSVCWLALDEADRDLGVFVNYFLAAIQHRFPDFGSTTKDLLRNLGTALDPRALVATITTDIYEDIRDYFVIVLDDYHLLDESLAVNRFVDLLLQHLPDNCHIILASRTIPNKLTLTRLVAHQEVAGLGVNDLRFTADEVQVLLNQHYGSELSDQQIAAITHRTEGWITGVLLSSQVSLRGMFKDILQIQGDQSHVFEYLATEVFAQQSERVQQFLLGSAILERMNGELIDELLQIQDSAATLRELEQKNLFVQQLEDGWYRFHHLFRAFLLARGKQTDLDVRNERLERRAGDLFAKRELFPEAINHYLRAKAYERAAASVEQIASQVWQRGQWATLTQWINSIPETVQEQHPWLTYYLAKISSDTGEYGDALGHFATARQRFTKQHDQAGLARTLVDEGICLIQTSEVTSAITNAARALDLVSEQHPIIVGQAHRTLGTAYAIKGDLQPAIDELELALETYELLDRAYDIALTHHDLGLAHYRAGNAALSEIHLQTAMRYWEQANNMAGLANTLNSLGVILHAQGKYAEAKQVLEETLSKAKLIGAPQTEAYAQASLGDLYRDVGATNNALEAYEEALQVSKRHALTFVIIYSLLSLGQVYAQQDNLEAAHYYIEQAQIRAEESHSDYNVGLYKLYWGILLYRQELLRESEQALSQAADTFKHSGAKQELARTCLHLAHVAFMDRRPDDVHIWLGIVAKLIHELDYIQFLAAEARAVPEIMGYATRHQIDPVFVQIAAKMRALLQLDPDTLEQPPDLEIKPQTLLDIHAFGNSEVILNGKRLDSADWGASNAKELFFLLLDNPQGLTKDQVIEALWEDTSLSKGNSRFHSTTYRLRRALYQECLLREGHTYRLNLEIPYAYDVGRFRQLASANPDQPAQMVRQYRQAVELYSGEYLADIYSEWAQATRQQLERTCSRLLTTLSKHYYEQGDYELCIQFSKRALNIDAFQEELYRRLMACYAFLGNRTAALRSYEECSQMLQQELGLDPTPETETLCKRILDNQL